MPAREVLVLPAMQRNLGGWIGCAALLSFGCSGPSVESSSPSSGPYGTTVMIRGDGLDDDGARIVFENSVIVPRDSALVQSWGDENIVFRVPTPASGAFRVEVSGSDVDAGRFEPAPWRPSALSIDDEQRRRLAWAKLDADTIVEAIRGEGTLEIHFVDGDGTRTIRSLGVETGSVELVATGPDSVEGYFFDGNQREDLGWFAATRNDAQFLIGDLSDDVDGLLAADRDEQGSYVWLSDIDHGQLLQCRFVDGELVEAQVIDDPADPSSERRLVAARGQQMWRVWTSNQSNLIDDYFLVFGAYLAPGASALGAAIELGSGDDGASLLATHGVSASGHVAVEFCATDVDPIASTQRTCGSLIAGPEGVLHKEQAAKNTERTLYYAFDAGAAAFECKGGVHELAWLDALDDASGASGAPTDPVFAPCAVEGPMHELDANGVPSFASSAPAGAVVLSRD